MHFQIFAMIMNLIAILVCLKIAAVCKKEGMNVFLLYFLAFANGICFFFNLSIIFYRMGA